jgi:hypothetical protein
MRIPADKHPLLARQPPCPGKLRLKNVSRSSGLAYKLPFLRH